MFGFVQNMFWNQSCKTPELKLLSGITGVEEGNMNSSEVGLVQNIETGSNFLQYYVLYDDMFSTLESRT